MEEKVEYQVVPFETVLSMGDIFARSGYFSDAKEQAQAVVKMLAGQEMGVGPFASMSGIHIIQGKPEVGAHLLAAVLKRSGKYIYRVQQPIAPDAVSLEFFERDGDRWVSLGVSTFTAADAKQAGTGNMQKFPRNMLFARALSNGVKWYCPDVSLTPLYSTGEIDQSANAVYIESEIVDGVEKPHQQDINDLYGHPLPQESNGSRPLQPDDLRDRLREFAVKYIDQDGDVPVDKIQQQMIAACLDKVCGEQARRYTFTKDIFGWQSTADMKLCQFHALNKWLGQPKDGDFDMNDENLELCRNEATRLVNSVVHAEAVGTLFEEEDDARTVRGIHS